MKRFANCYSKKFLNNILNNCFRENRFPSSMKVAKISLIFKKLGNSSKDNHQTISTLSDITKFFEGIIYSQINYYVENKFPKYLTCFNKTHNTQNSLLRMIKSWNVSNWSKVGVIIMDLSRAFDSLNHDLLLAKLEADV